MDTYMLTHIWTHTEHTNITHTQGLTHASDVYIHRDRDINTHPTHVQSTHMYTHRWDMDTHMHRVT